MKKIKKMLAGLLGAAMVLTSFGSPAWAAGADKMPTIDTNKQGSLTVYKYEYNSAEGAATLNEGTGEATDSSNVPNDAKPLAGVEFTIYKIADITQTTGGNVKLQYNPIVNGIDSDNFNKNVTDYSAVSAAIDSAINAGTLQPAKPAAKTVLDSDEKTASVTFSDLDLGVYAVKETNAPSQVVSKTANFLVSVPMTNKAGDDWLYDIKAYPKNATVYAGINLVKTGTTIKANGTTEKANLAGVTFALQSRPTGSESSVAWTDVKTYTTDSNGSINVTGLAPNDYRFIETDLGENNGYILNGKPYKFTVDNDGKIKVGSAAATETAIITADNEKPDLKKEVKKGETYANAADAPIGDMVEWKVSASVPSNVDQLKKYSITDKMSNALTWVDDKAELKLTYKSNNAEVPGFTLTEGETNDYKLTSPTNDQKGGSWTIEFTEAGKKKLKDNNISSIEVTFKTKLNDNAKIGKDGNLNDAQLDYSNAIYPSVDPTNPNDGKTPGEDHIKDQAIVYSFSIDVTKVDGNNTATTLEGVHFDLYKYSGSDESPSESDLKGSNGKKINTTDLVTDGAGKITVNGLENGNYYLVETKAAAGGYNLLRAPVKVIIKQTYTVTKNTTVIKDENGNVTSTTTVVNETFTGGDAANAGTYSVTIENRKGFTLPKTGDIGTAMFLIIGIGGMLAAVYIMLRGRKRA